ncbi:MAG: S24/S26 family peptidase [Clostridia bacterium]|nr:S24/S26 family peptidase [Clostridia bacterium]
MEFSMKEIFPLIEEGIKNGGKYRFYPKGVSMLPLLREGIDSVMLSAVGEIKKYDMVLYRRDDGQFVLHRVVDVKDGKYNFCGDNQCYIEEGIRPDQIKAIVTAFYRGEEYIAIDNKEYVKYAKRRVASIPMRHKMLSLKGYLKRIKEILLKK